MSQNSSQHSSSTPILSKTTSSLALNPVPTMLPFRPGFSAARQAQANPDLLESLHHASMMEDSSDTASESGSTDIEESELSFSTIFADLHSLSQTLNASLTDTPFEWNSRGLHVRWLPPTSSSLQTKTQKSGGNRK